jgi:hypothetical protein
MAAVNRRLRPRDRAAQPHAQNCGGGPPAYDSDRNGSLGGKQTADAARNWLRIGTCKGIVVAIDDFDFGRLNVGLTALTRTEKIEFFGFVLPKLSS